MKKIFHSFSFQVNDEENKAVVVISLIAGEVGNDEYPFYVEVEVEGYFDYNYKEDGIDAGFDNLLRNNCAAILYPYLRSTISNLTNLANDYPTYNLPTINIIKAIQNEEEQEDNKNN